MQIIIFDSEFTAWQGSQERRWSEAWEHRELIQLAAMKLEVNNQGVESLSSFNELIKPVINPILSSYITDLTGISQSMLDNMGVDFHSAMDSFYQFCAQGSLPCFAWGHDGKILQENCHLNKLEMASFNGGFFNLNQLARTLGLDGADLCSGDLAEHLALDLVGHSHNALYDVRSIALALNHWITEGKLDTKHLISRQ